MKQLFTALLAAALLSMSCGPDMEAARASAERAEDLLNQAALRQAQYPEYPQEPQWQDYEGWEDYEAAVEAYDDALTAIRGDLRYDGTWEALESFAGRSTALILREREGENTVYSPISLWTALAMLVECSGEESRAQVLSALGAADPADLREQVSYMWQSLYTDDGIRTLILANSLWLSDRLEAHYAPETLDVLAQDYFADTYAVPMGDSSADEAITAWIAEQTRGLIGTDAPAVKTDSATLLLLASSLYYKAAWSGGFDSGSTEEDIFTCADGTETRIDFMHKIQDNASFLREDDWQAAYLRLSTGSMTFVLPDEGISPEALLQDEDFLSNLIDWNDSHSGIVEWSVPKFDASSTLNLPGTLEALGIRDLIDPGRADLTALTDLPAYLGDAKQLTRVKVDEEGVEAAAATIMAVPLMGALTPEEPEICVMDLDRPFLFVISVEDFPLFVGVVNQV